MRITARSRLLVVIGNPVDHSLSPVMHNAAIAALGLDAVYMATRVEGAALPGVLGACAAMGLAGNVTVPHKMDVARELESLSPAAEALGAVNTFWPDGGTLRGDNTDVAGVLEALDACEAEGPWLVAGTGGAARAVAAAAGERGITLLVQSRSPEQARAFAQWALDLGVPRAAADDGGSVGVAINASPLGLAPTDPHPFPEDRLDPGGVALDLAYAPGGTPWIRACRARGLRAADGRVMLLAQGAHAFERFFPGVPAPREIMAAAVERALTP
jgi:shikimate dehydrogenase